MRLIETEKEASPLQHYSAFPLALALLCFALRLLPSNSPSPAAAAATDVDTTDVDTVDKCAWPAGPLIDLT